jgi:biopolymer transport protein ExbD
MNIRLAASHRPLAAFSYSSLTDIVLLLLVFFLLTSSFIVTEGLKVALPPAAHAVNAEATRLTLTLLPDGRIAVNGAVVPDDRLEEAVRATLHDPANDIVVLSSDRSAPFSRAVFAMDAAKGAGAVHFFISTIPRDR